MTNFPPNQRPGFYFALPRLLYYFLRGETAPRSESNFAEALCASAVVIALPWLVCCQFLPCSIAGSLGAIALIPAVIIAWLAAMFITSIILAAAHRLGLWRTTPNRDLQHIMVWCVVALVAGHLAFDDGPASWVGLAILTLIFLNLFAAVALQLTGEPAAASRG